jgi:hypothetical protein
MNNKLMTLAAIGIAFAGLGTTDTVLAQAAARTPRMGIARTSPARGMRRGAGSMPGGFMPGGRGQFTPNGPLPQGSRQGLQNGLPQGPKNGLQKGPKNGPKNGLQRGPQQGFQRGPQQGFQRGPQQGF